MKGLKIKLERVVPLLFACFSYVFIGSDNVIMCTEENIMGYYSSVSQMERIEQEALYGAIQGFVGTWWNGSDLYPDPCGWTSIQGVSCDLYDGLWYVSTINIGPIYENSLTCSSNPHFSHHLFNLKHLRALSFFNCFLVPSQHSIISNLRWERFTNTLESLEFRSNQGLIGTIPKTIGCLKKLQSLVILQNGLSGNLPIELGELTELRNLVLSGNNFTGPIPPSLGNLTQLLILDFSRNNLGGSMPLTLGSIASLIKLDLSHNKLQGKLPIAIGNLKNLTLLDLGNNNFSGGLVWSIQQMVSLKEMVMSHNQLLGNDLNSIQWENLKNLEVLDLSKTGLNGTIPKSITRMERLRFLGLNSNSLTGKVPPNLSSMPCISAIYLGANNLSGEIELSQGFFRKFSGRFGAWENPYLCYNSDFVSKSFAPIGVKPCNVQKGKTSSTTTQKSFSAANNYNNNSYFEESLGISSYSFVRVFFLHGLSILLLWNVIS